MGSIGRPGISAVLRERLARHGWREAGNLTFGVTFGAFTFFILSFSCIKIASRLLYFCTVQSLFLPERACPSLRDMNRLSIVVALLGPVVTGSA